MSSSEIDKCSIGVLNGDECHKPDFTRKNGILDINELGEKDMKLILLRSGFKNLNTICHHHMVFYLQRFEKKQKYCCDPLRKHAKLISSKY